LRSCTLSDGTNTERETGVLSWRSKHTHTSSIHVHEQFFLLKRHTEFVIFCERGVYFDDEYRRLSWVIQSLDSISAVNSSVLRSHSTVLSETQEASEDRKKSVLSCKIRETSHAESSDPPVNVCDYQEEYYTRPE
jgi:hypothetical protein